MGYFSIFAIVMLTAFLFYMVDAVSKLSNDVKLVASYVQQKQRQKTRDTLLSSSSSPAAAVVAATEKKKSTTPDSKLSDPVSESRFDDEEGEEE